MSSDNQELKYINDTFHDNSAINEFLDGISEADEIYMSPNVKLNYGNGGDMQNYSETEYVLSTEHKTSESMKMKAAVPVLEGLGWEWCETSGTWHLPVMELLKDSKL